MISCFAQEAETAVKKLEAAIKTVEQFELYDRQEYPLGRFEEELYRKDAEFAEEQLVLLKSVNEDSLSETQRISLELLRFTLQNRIDAYTHQMYLNPIQADQGFHLNLNYRVRPILSYKDAKKYLRVLNAIPQYLEEHVVLLRKGLKKGCPHQKLFLRDTNPPTTNTLFHIMPKARSMLLSLSCPNPSRQHKRTPF